MYIPLCVCDFILENLCVIKQVAPSVGRMLDNCRQWTSSGLVASMTIYLPHDIVAVQHFSGCPKDMGMCIVIAGNALVRMTLWTQLM